ncbi:MAG: hypothetical protein ACLQGP_10545 [Isosphaeraceae bacterium]
MSKAFSEQALETRIIADLTGAGYIQRTPSAFDKALCCGSHWPPKVSAAWSLRRRINSRGSSLTWSSPGIRSQVCRSRTVFILTQAGSASC